MSSLGKTALSRQNRTAYLFLLPWLIGFFCLTLGPYAGFSVSILYEI